jgi:hypothetical protein
MPPKVKTTKPKPKTTKTKTKTKTTKTKTTKTKTTKTKTTKPKTAKTTKTKTNNSVTNTENATRNSSNASGNATRNSGNTTRNSGNATGNSGNATRNSGNATRNSGNTTGNIPVISVRPNRSHPRGVNFNGILRNAIINKPIFNSGKTITGSTKYATEDEYNASFGDVIEFGKKYPNKKIFDYVLFHKSKLDGLFGAYIYWNLITNGGTDKSHSHIVFKGVDTGNSRDDSIFYEIQKIKNDLVGKNVLLLDVVYNNATLNTIKSTAASLTIIDDHVESKSGLNGEFKSPNHCSAASAFKFFNPEQKVNMLIQHIDTNDMKFFIPYLHYNHHVITALTVRILKNFHNVKKLRKNNYIIPVYDDMFDRIHAVFTNGDAKFMTLVGNYMNEYMENTKFLIAQHARIAKFGEYTVGVLNFDADGLTKPIARQIVSNFKNQNQHIDFVLLWGYHYIRGHYRVQLIDDHQQTRLNMAKIAKQYDSTAGGAGGHPHVANFYTKQDIHKLVKFSGDTRNSK